MGPVKRWDFWKNDDAWEIGFSLTYRPSSLHTKAGFRAWAALGPLNVAFDSDGK